MIFKILLILFALFAIANTVRQFREKKASLYWLCIWSAFWAIVIFVAFLPQTTDIVAHYVGIGRGADLVVYVAVVLLSYGYYRVMVQQEKTRSEITELVRQIAILEVKKKPPYDKSA